MTEFQLTEAHRQIANMVSIGVVVEARYSNPPEARVQIGNLKTTWLRMACLRAAQNDHWHPFELGEEVIVLAPSGNMASAMILAALNNGTNTAIADRPTLERVRFADGAVIEYDREAHHLSAVLPAGATTSLVSDGGIHVTGDVHITGAVTVSETVTAAKEVTAKGIHLTTHKHENVMPGGAKTGGPV